MNSTADKQAIKKRIDYLSRNKVYLRDNYRCQITGRMDNLHVCHLFHRKSCPSLRWELDNQFLFHATIHDLFDNKCPKMFHEYAKYKLGIKRYNELKLMRNKVLQLNERQLLNIEESLK